MVSQLPQIYEKLAIFAGETVGTMLFSLAYMLGEAMGCSGVGSISRNYDIEHAMTTLLMKVKRNDN